MSVKLRSQLTVQQVGDEALVLDLDSGQIHQLNATAAWILAQCDGDKSLERIIADFAAHFSVDPATAQHDVNAALRQLAQVRVVELDTP